MLWRENVVGVSISLVCFVCTMLLFSRLVLFSVYMSCVRCGVLCCCVLFHWFVVRICGVVVVVFSVLHVCYGVNDFPVCGCILYAPSLRCYYLFVCCCLLIYVIGLFCALFSYCLVFFVFGVYVLFVVRCVDVCCDTGLSCVYVLLLCCFPFCCVMV